MANEIVWRNGHAGGVTTQMRVLQLGPYPPPHGGVQSNLVALRTFLRSRGIPCAVINITRHRRCDGEDIYYPKSGLDVIRLLRRLEYDVIHLQVGGMLSTRVLCLGLVCTMQPACKVLMTFHSGGYPSTPEGRAASPNSFAGFVLRRFDGLIGVNAEIVSFFERLGVNSKRVRLIEPHAFLPDAAPAQAMPEELERFFAAHNPVLISVGGLESEYDVPLQIDAVDPVRRSFPSAGLVVIGSGSRESEIRAKVAASPCSEHILLCGDVPHAVTLRAIARAQVMLRTTLYDGDAISIREALHLGTPVIASDNGMRPHGVHLVPKSNQPALVDAVQAVLNRPVNSQATYASDDRNLQAVLNFYQELMAQKN